MPSPILTGLDLRSLLYLPMGVDELNHPTPLMKFTIASPSGSISKRLNDDDAACSQEV